MIDINDLTDVEEEETLVHEAFKEDGLLAQHFPGYIPRPQQIQLAEKIKQAIQDHQVLFAQAPTGVGKSLGGLVPAAEIIFDEDAPVVVVTSTIPLQEQYFHKDVPLLEKVLGRSLSSTLIKGRANYLCNYKSAQVAMEGKIHPSLQKEYTELMTWADKTKTGDMSELDFVPRNHVWADFAAIGDNECNGKQCPMHSTCHYYRERKKVMTSKLIICNYHYFLSAMAHPGLLPEGIRVVIMDEGHEISAIARDFQQRTYSIYAMRDAFKSFLKTGKILERTDASIAAELQSFVIEAEMNRLEGSIEEMFQSLLHFYRAHKPGNRDNWTVNAEQRKNMQDMAQNHYDCLVFTRKATLRRHQEFCESLLRNYGISEEQMIEHVTEEEMKWLTAIEKLHDALSSKLWFLETFFGFDTKKEKAAAAFGDPDSREGAPEPSEDATIIHWLQEQGDIGVVLYVKPSMAAPLMGPIMDTAEVSYTPIVLSATLAVNGSFDHLANDLGVQKPYQELIVSSPFDLKNNLLWYLPKNAWPGNVSEHQMYAAEEMLKVVRKLEGRTLCLFTSTKALIEATNHFRRSLPDTVQVVAQGEYPRQRIVEMMKENPHTVIMGTRSFFTGIDIQGQHLSAVLVDKLPYPMIGDPVNDYLMNRPRGFWTFTLPEMVIALKQGFGRGNRTIYDKCVVAVYDGRLGTAQYRPIIFNSFEFVVTATREWETVCTFLDSIDYGGE